MGFEVERVRAEFPALSVLDEGRRRIYLDNPAGTQVPQRVIDRMTDCLVRTNANLGGYFPTTVAAEELVDEAHAAMADFVNAGGPEEIVFGQNMTTLTFHISRSIGRRLEPGDEIIVTRMDHDGNISPWLLLAEDLGLTVRWYDFDPETYEFDTSRFADLLSERTRVVALNYASNLTGTLNDVKALVAMARDAGALTYVDAVQFAPHGLIDVREVGCDFLVCSPYKFYGPHQGVLWGRENILEDLFPYKVRPASPRSPGKFETGTLSHEGLAGTLGAVEHFAWIGTAMGGVGEGATRREAVAEGLRLSHEHETGLASRLIEKLSGIPGLRVHGITNPNRMAWRVPTVSITVEGHAPKEIAGALAKDNIFVWDGHNYALETVRKLGLEDKGGVVRIGLAHYNTASEVDETVSAVAASVA